MTSRGYLSDAVGEETQVRDCSNLNTLSYKEIPFMRIEFLRRKNQREKMKKTR